MSTHGDSAALTLTEALAALHRAGRIARPWLSGMLTRLDWQPTDGGGPVQMRLCDTGEHVIAFTLEDMPEPEEGHRYAYVLDDPATVGCLLALVREAAGDDTICPRRHGRKGSEWELAHWESEWGDMTEYCAEEPYIVTGDSEGSALAAALIALAEASP